ncbi:MAG: hypothetical protein K2L88_01910 [Clostridiales bacterium]|nr:hypothetical protein [Clostridiales bacterium]
MTAVTLCGCGGGVESPDILPHLTIAESKHAVPIDGYERFVMPEVADTSYRERVELLYNTVVYDGKQPIFQTDDTVKPIYDAAHEFLENYIHDDWKEASREVNTVHAIHDYLISSTDYDFELYRSYQAGADFAPSDAPAFYIDGVLLGGKAVCDGLARAFNFLCAMEGIKSVRVTGSFASSLHAWNKVKVGGEWYNVDVTADAVHYNVSGKNYKQIAHGYMLVCDDTLKSFDDGHDFVDTQFTADADYDYYSSDFLKIGDKFYSRVVKSQAELNAIFAAVSEQKTIGKLELKLDFAGKTQVNGADMYRNEILAAYQKVDNVGFKLTDGNSPYFRFPNGVYLFLIYK